MADHMVRTQVYLPKATYDALVERAKEQGLTMASQIRAALDDYLRRSQGEEEGAILRPDDPIFQMIGMADSGLTDVSENHDYYLYGMPQRSPAAGQLLRETAKTSRPPRARRSAPPHKSRR